MKLVQFLLILFLLPGLPLFQIDQAVDFDWVVCEHSLVIKSEVNNFPFDQNMCTNLKPPSVFLNQSKTFLQLKDPLSTLLSYFQGTSPFWRPPPRFHPPLV